MGTAIATDEDMKAVADHLEEEALQQDMLGFFAQPPTAPQLALFRKLKIPEVLIARVKSKEQASRLLNAILADRSKNKDNHRGGASGSGGGGGGGGGAGGAGAACAAGA